MSFSPTGGPSAGGTLVTIVGGVGFTWATRVTLGGVGGIAPTFVDQPGTTLQFRTPAKLASDPDTVALSTTGPAYSIGTFTYGQIVYPPSPPYEPSPRAPAPVILAVSPNSGPVSAGNTVTVTGTNFQSGATVAFGTVASTSVTFVSATSLTVRVPQGTGTVSVTVLNPDGLSAQLTGAYTYTGAAGYKCVAGTAVGVTSVNATYTTSTKIVRPNAYVTYRFSCTNAAAGAIITILGAQRSATSTTWSAFTPFTSRVADASGNALFFIRAPVSWWSFRAQIGPVFSNAVQTRWMN
jgi:hypothetical protein